jgi:FMN phosphatase YigB (HAD superfamily)
MPERDIDANITAWSEPLLLSSHMLKGGSVNTVRSPKPPPTFRAGQSEPRSVLRRSPLRVDSLANIGALVTEQGAAIDLLSIDIFDTLLTRSCGQPDDLFLWLGRRLQRTGQISVSAEMFAVTRSRAEQTVWKREGGLDSAVTLETIHGELVRALDMDSASASMLVKEEFQLELEASRLVDSARALRALPSDLRVVLTTDTYFTRTQIDSLLDLHGLGGTFELLVSSEIERSKSSGGSFSQMMSTFGCSATNILHVGDHPHSDVDVPRAMGLRTCWVPQARLNRYERLLSDHAVATSGLSSALAGASRLARLRSPATSAHDCAICEVAAGVAAPALIGYVLWVLRRAEALGLERLYFLARDGQVLHDIAVRLVEKMDSKVSVRYLAVSRQSTNLAATFDASSEETDWVFRDAKSLTVSAMLDRLGLAHADIEALFERLGRPVPATATELAPILRQALTSDEPVRERMLSSAVHHRQLVTRYLSQEGLVDDDQTGIVDFGGVGSQVRAVHALTTAAGGRPPQIFLVGLDHPADAGLELPLVEPDWLRDTHTWLYDHRRGLGHRRRRGFGTCFQMFTAADHNSVSSYSENHGIIEPVFDDDNAGSVVDWGLGTLRATVRDVVDCIVLDDDLVDVGANLRVVVVELIDRFWTTPSTQEAAAWGTYPLEGAQAGADCSDPVGAPLFDTRDRVRNCRWLIPQAGLATLVRGFRLAEPPARARWAAAR